MDHEYFMSKAIELALENMRSNQGEPFGALIVKDGKIVGSWCSSISKENNPTAHAEMEAIRKACENLGNESLEGCVVYTNCEPCPMCLSALHLAKVKEIYFANTREDAAEIWFDDSKIYKALSNAAHKKLIPSYELERSDASKVFDERKKR